MPSHAGPCDTPAPFPSRNLPARGRLQPTMQQVGHGTTRVRALDGLRGLAVAGVLAYHCGFGWARGGFLGVSLFFTLSGFLITSLLLRERADTGGIALGAFWARRARRLLPAAMVALGGVVVFGATVAAPSQVRDLRGDIVGALAYVANWRFIVAGTSYGDLWSSPSPVQHFWSLAIEEQLYLVVPLLVTGALAIGRGRRRVLAAVLAAAIGLSLVATFLAEDHLRAYYGTDTRAAELLVGALLAVVVVARPRLGGPVLRVAGPIALVGVLAAWSTMSQDDGRLYAGGLLVHAALVAVIILAARTDGVFARSLSAPPLRWLGRISYAAYLYHWPLFLWLTTARTGLDGVALAALRLTVCLVLADASTRWLEEPLRSGAGIRRPRPMVAAGLLTTIAIVAATVVVTSATPAVEPFRTADAATLLAPASSERSSPVVSLPPVRTKAPIDVAPGERLRVYVAGDSNAYILGQQLITWGADHGVDVWASGWFGCEVVTGGEFRYAGRVEPTSPKCDAWPVDRAAEIAAIHPHIVIVLHGSFDVLDRRLPGLDGWVHVGVPAYDSVAKQAIGQMVDLFLDNGAHVLWAAYPWIRTGVIDGIPPARDFPEADAARMDRFNTLARQVVASRPGAAMLELQRRMRTWPKGELDPDHRLDGLHPNPDEVPTLAEWIGDQALALVRRP
jgi:peptidoglycan/LPS O-acetylase OafA/YrhL/lysophospholipase L1-like esterase